MPNIIVARTPYFPTVLSLITSVCDVCTRLDVLAITLCYSSISIAFEPDAQKHHRKHSGKATIFPTRKWRWPFCTKLSKALNRTWKFTNGAKPYKAHFLMLYYRHFLMRDFFSHFHHKISFQAQSTYIELCFFAILGLIYAVKLWLSSMYSFDTVYVTHLMLATYSKCKKASMKIKRSKLQKFS